MKIYYNCKIKIDTYHVMYPTCGIYILQSLHLQFSSFQHDTNDGIESGIFGECPEEA